MTNGKKINIYSIAIPMISIVIALIIAVFLVMWVKGDNFILSMTSLFRAIWSGSFGNKLNFYETLVSTTPIIFTGVANAVAFKAGLFNIGVEGQFIIGILTATIIGLIPGVPPVLHIILLLLGGTLGGALWALLPAYLKAKKGINEVVNTIMMNYIAISLSNYLVLNVMNLKGQATTPIIQNSAMLWRFLGSNIRLNTGLFIAIIIAVLINFILNKTTIGYEIKAIGTNSDAAEYGGINVSRNILLSMLISGGIAGLGGAVHLAGIQHQGFQLGGGTGYGFDGITVALLAKSNPAVCLISALLIGTLNNCSLTLQIERIPKEIVALIQAIIIIFIASDYAYKWLLEKRKKGVLTHD